MSYMDTVAAVSPSGKGVKNVSDIVAALVPPVLGAEPAASTALVPASPAAAPQKSASQKAAAAAVAMAPGVAAGAAGAFLWRKHPVLGFLVGHAVGQNAMPIYRGGDGRKDALVMLGIETAGIAGSLFMKKSPVVGYFLGVGGAAAASAAIPNSPIRKRYEAWQASK